VESYRKYLAEFLGTVTLVFVGALSLLAALAFQGSVQVSVAFGFGLALLAALYAFGEIPAVTSIRPSRLRCSFRGG
jgi:glycerol uptake facilitator-like aquaporin